MQATATQNMTMPGLTLNRQQAAELAQISISSLDRAIYHKELRVTRVGRRVVIPRQFFEEWLFGSQQPNHG